MEKYICIHGHFYQPPRENPWLEDVELQDEVYPYHDWNERITAECYEPNTSSRILDSSGWIKKIVNNYARISFNFGPTLLSWMETNEPEVYRKIIESDRESQQSFSGHGSALAQAYNHLIMPLANRRDKYTQVIWGIRDFQHRFGRPPEGMWLPETAVDLETLDIMAEHGIRFTILAPHQARRVREKGTNNWHALGTKGIDTSMPYQLYLPDSGRTINVFFYNAEISHAVAFEKLLSNGEQFASRLLSGFAGSCSSHQLVNIATDGETYGHHHRHGDMALAYALNYIETKNLARITNYAEYLEKYPPTHEVEIGENTSWSCAHGIERWRSNCGCNSGMHPSWSQAWRTPLRNALNWLRNTVASRYEEHARWFLKDPWAARNDYIEVVLNRSPESLARFLTKHATRPLNQEEHVTVLKLLELQRNAMLMFTSCGWFFDDIKRIEAIQILQYAGRVIQLASELFNTDLKPQFLEMLVQAKSNIPEYHNGAYIYKQYVQPAMVDLIKVGAHYAICSLFETYDEHSHIYCYAVNREDHQILSAGRARLTVGRARVTSEITKESATLNYVAVNLGNHNVNASVQVYKDRDSYQKMVKEITSAFSYADFSEVIRLLDHHFAGVTYSLKDLFRDKQRKILDLILDTTLAEIAADYRRIYEFHAPLMRVLKDLNIPQPKALYTTAEFVLNTSLRQALASDTLDLQHIKVLLSEAEISNIQLDHTVLGYVLKQTLNRMSERLRNHPEDRHLLAHLDAVIALIRSLPFEVNMWKLQNIYYELLQSIYPEFQKRAEEGDETARAWVQGFNSLGDKLRIRR